jgi:hypothetical protein
MRAGLLVRGVGEPFWQQPAAGSLGDVAGNAGDVVVLASARTPR